MDSKQVNLILELQNHNVYYVKTDNLNYYITIPKYINNTNICIELKSKMGNYDIESNDEIWVMENIKTTFSYRFFIKLYDVVSLAQIINCL